jgi:hypothetical protein
MLSPAWIFLIIAAFSSIAVYYRKNGYALFFTIVAAVVVLIAYYALTIGCPGFNPNLGLFVACKS